jgi:hypothetical protein
MSAKEKVEQANALHAEAVAKKKKFTTAWWAEWEKASTEFHAASKALATAKHPQDTLDALAKWNAAYAKVQSLDGNNAPYDETSDAWWRARDAASEALCEEAGLIMKLEM